MSLNIVIGAVAIADPAEILAIYQTLRCHWLVNFSLRLAERVDPDRPWRIITSDSHSTVWDGYDLLFDFNL